MRVKKKPAPAVSKLAKQIGQRIFDRRTQLQMSQRDVSRGAKMSIAHACDVENGRSRIGAESLKRVAETLEVDMNYFF